MTPNNILIFPKSKKNTPSQSLDELIETVDRAKKEHIEFLVEDTMSFVFTRLFEEGFDLTQKHCEHSTALMVESFKAALYNSVGLHHDLHSMSESIFSADMVVFASEIDLKSSDEELPSSD